MTNFEKLKEVVSNVEKDVAKFESGNGSAGTRVRKAMQEIKILAQVIRTEVTEIKNKN